jgi:geranylgeranyl diphosphate synthase type II
VGGDIISNKKTFLLLKALELAKGNERQELQHWLGLKDFDKALKVAAVKTVYEQLGIRSLTEQKMQTYFEEGFKQLKGLQITNETYSQALLAVTQELMHRER